MNSEPRIMLDEPTREEWLAARRTHVGGSEVAALLGAGLHPYLSPLKLWLQKTGRAPESTETALMRLGKKAEAMILSEYADETGCRASLNSKLFRHAEAPFGGTPDAFRVEPDDEGVELKWHSTHIRKDFGDPGTDAVPDHHFVQANSYAGLTNRPRWHFGVLFGNEGVTPYTIRFDRELYDVCVEASSRFWRDHILADRPPELDGSEDARAYVESRFPRDKAPLRPANKQEEDWLQALLDARARIAALKEEEETIRTYLEAAIGEAAGIEALGLGRVTWKATKDSQRIDWKAVYASLLPKLPPDLIETAEKLVAEATTVSPGSRRFLPTDLRKED